MTRQNKELERDSFVYQMLLRSSACDYSGNCDGPGSGGVVMHDEGSPEAKS